MSAHGAIGQRRADAAGRRRTVSQLNQGYLTDFLTPESRER